MDNQQKTENLAPQQKINEELFKKAAELKKKNVEIQQKLVELKKRADEILHPGSSKV
jgi:hypothetical protein